VLRNPHHPALPDDPSTRTEPPPVLPGRRPGARWPIGVLRAVSVLVLVQVLLQAALAGGFITGQVSLLGLHSANGILLFLTSGLLVVVAVLLVRPGRGPWWPIVLTTALWLLIAVQAGIGFARLVGLHIPIGVALMGMISAFTWWTCAYRAPR
jgi:hypothetical protein